MFLWVFFVGVGWGSPRAEKCLVCFAFGPLGVVLTTHWLFRPAVVLPMTAFAAGFRRYKMA